MNIGAGRIVYQELTRISKAVEDGEFETNSALLDTVDAAGDGAVHIMGLLSPGGVHSHEDHFLAMIKLAAERHAGRVAVHVFLDGRDTPPRSAGESLERLQRQVDALDDVRVASVSGRYWAMDRDQRWDRIRRAWTAIVHAEAGFESETALQALEMAYERDENDEFVQPTVIGGGQPIADGDSAVFINFRADRSRQLSRALVDQAFDAFDGQRPRLAGFATMTQYETELDARVAFPPNRLEHLFGQELATAGLAQLRIAETEKYAHVTYFFNGGREQAFDGEDRKMIPSPDVTTYDLQPEMSAPALTRALVDAIESRRWPVIVCNVANPDMVGHSGIFDAAVRAVEAVDRLLGEVARAVDAAGGEMLVTADHGNVEQMTDPETGQAHTAHTIGPVPLVFVGRQGRMEPEGSLRDIAPTMLRLLGLRIPDEMNGRPLVHAGEDPEIGPAGGDTAAENAVG